MRTACPLRRRLNGSAESSRTLSAIRPANGVKSKPGQLDDRTYRVEALAKGLQILRLFTTERPQLRLKDIVTLSGLPMPTAFRLVATLASEGFLERLADGVVRPGTAILQLGLATLEGLDVVSASTLILRELAEQTKQTVNLGVLSGADVVYVGRIYSQSLVTANIRVGSSLPAIVTSIGKVLLAHLSDAERSACMSAATFGGSYGPNAVRSLAELDAQLVRIRTDGFATQDQEVAAGLRSIAAPVRQADGAVVAGINIAVPAAQFTLKQLNAAFREPLLAAARQISLRLGARPS